MPVTLIDQIREELREVARHLEARGWLLSQLGRGEVGAKWADRWHVRMMIRRNGLARVMLYHEQDRLEQEGFSALLAAQQDDVDALAAFTRCEELLNRWLDVNRAVPSKEALDTSAPRA